MNSLPRTDSAVNLSNVNLPSDASAALVSTRDAYFAWLELADPALWMSTAICYQQFAIDAEGIGIDDTITLFLDAAPMWNQFLAEQSGEARNAVLYPVRFVDCERGS